MTFEDPRLNLYLPRLPWVEIHLQAMFQHVTVCKVDSTMTLLPHELRKKPPTFTFICRLIWGACAKGKCWFAKARESKSAPRKPRKLTRKHVNVHVLILGIWYGKSAKGSRKMCERFAKAEVFKVQESPFSRSALNGKCKAFLWKY